VTPADAVLEDALREAGCTDEEVRVMLVAREAAGDAERAARAARLLVTVAAVRPERLLLEMDSLVVVTDFARRFLP